MGERRLDNMWGMDMEKRHGLLAAPSPDPAGPVITRKGPVVPVPESPEMVSKAC